MRAGLCALVLLAAAAPARAETLCGESPQLRGGELRIVSRDFLAACRPGGRCRIITYELDRDAMLGWDHQMAMTRDDAQGAWSFSFASQKRAMDPQAELSVTVDDKPPLRIPAEAVRATDGAAGGVELDARLTDLLLDAFKPGNAAVLRYSGGGEPVRARLSLIGLSDALKWANCAQGELVSGKTDQEAPSPEELSGPEPGVPVDPTGSDDDAGADGEDAE